MLGVWIAPVMAQVMMTFGFGRAVLLKAVSFGCDTRVVCSEHSGDAAIDIDDLAVDVI
jgi:hypothetical protein